VSASEPPKVDYDEFTAALAAVDADFSAAELHGTLTGLLCAGAGERAMTSLSTLVPEATSGALREMFVALQRQTLQQLQDTEFTFALLIPGEDLALDAQVAALADWCRGFIVGLTAAGVPDPAHLAGDAGEAIRDFARIAATEVDQTEIDGEEGEREFTELVEYVRVGVQLVFEQFRRHSTLPRE